MTASSMRGSPSKFRLVYGKTVKSVFGWIPLKKAAFSAQRGRQAAGKSGATIPKIGCPDKGCGTSGFLFAATAYVASVCSFG